MVIIDLKKKCSEKDCERGMDHKEKDMIVERKPSNKI